MCNICAWRQRRSVASFCHFSKHWSMFGPRRLKVCDICEWRQRRSVASCCHFSTRHPLPRRGGGLASLEGGLHTRRRGWPGRMADRSRRRACSPFGRGWAMDPIRVVPRESRWQAPLRQKTHLHCVLKSKPNTPVLDPSCHILVIVVSDRSQSDI